MDINKIFESNYLKTSDLEGKARKVIIREVRLEELGNDKEKKMVMYFEDASKGMVLNKTNAFRISGAYGSNTDSWIGKEIILYAEATTFQGKPVEGLRVRIPQTMAADEEPIPF